MAVVDERNSLVELYFHLGMKYKDIISILSILANKIGVVNRGHELITRGHDLI